MANEVKNAGKAAKKLAGSLGIPVEAIDGRKKKQVNFVLDLLEKKGDKEAPKPGYFESLEKEDTNEAFERNAERRHEYIKQLLIEIQTETSKLKKLDNLFLSKPFAVPIFFMTLGLVFFITFGTVGEFFSSLMQKFIVDGLLEKLVQLLEQLSTKAWLSGLSRSVLITGVGAVSTFLPQIVLLFLLLSVLDDIGYISRVAFMFDGFFKKLGLSGKAIFSLLTGFGCTTSAILATRNLESKSLRKKTSLLLPFLGCSAKLPVFLLICSVFFPKQKFLVLFLIYLLSIMLGIFILFVFQALSHKRNENFVMEMPRLRLPTTGRVLKSTYHNAKDFTSRVIFVVAVSCVLIWVLSNFDTHFGYTQETGEKSILENCAKFIAPLFAPLGFGNWGIVVAITFGMIARELIVSSIGMLNGAVGITALSASITTASSVVSFTAALGISFLVFVMFFTPCIPALSMTKKELGFKYMAFCAAFQFVTAYAVSFLVYNIIKGHLIVKWGLLVVLIALFVVLMLKLTKRTKCKNCEGCEKWLQSKTKVKSKSL